MKPLRHTGVIWAALLCAALAWPAEGADQRSTVGGLVVNFGVVPAAVALRADGHRDAHPLNPPAGSQHLLITLDDEKSHRRIGDAEVDVEVTDPHGRVDKKRLLHTQAAGLPDYSELFEFRWTGDYAIRITITPAGESKPVQARFVVHHTI